MDLGPRVVASWIWEVLNPQIAQCEYESEILERTLTFRAYNEAFERLTPLGQALLPEGRVIFEDIRGDVPEYDALMAGHDQALGELLHCARTLYQALLTSADFRLTINRINPTPEDADEALRYLASYVVNDLGELNRADSTFAAVWNGLRATLVVEAKSTGLVAPLAESRGRFAKVVVDTRGALAALRKQWSRKYDIPAAYVAGILETPAH